MSVLKPLLEPVLQPVLESIYGESESLPANVVVDREGNPVVDREGNYIVNDPQSPE